MSQEQGTILWLLVPWAQDILVELEGGKLNLDDYGLSAWRLMHMGAMPIPPSLVSRWQTYFPAMQYNTTYPDERLGEIVAVVIEVIPDGRLGEEEVLAFCEALPRHKRPRKVFFGEIPRNPTGKIQKTKLRKQYIGRNDVLL
jgi:hypothetical protein